MSRSGNLGKLTLDLKTELNFAKKQMQFQQQENIKLQIKLQGKTRKNKRWRVTSKKILTSKIMKKRDEKYEAFKCNNSFISLEDEYCVDRVIEDQARTNKVENITKYITKITITKNILRKYYEKTHIKMATMVLNNDILVLDR